MTCPQHDYLWVQTQTSLKESLCSSECPNGTYGFGCLPCSEHCVNSLCEKFSEYGVCSDGCEVGYTKGNCTKGITLLLLKHNGSF